MNLKTIILVSGFILVFSLAAYYFLGGLKEVEYSIHPSTAYTVIGKEYQGNNNSPRLEALFSETKSLTESGLIDGVLVIVNNENKYDDENNLVGYFIGVIVTKVPNDIPEGYSTKKYSSSSIIRARIESHNLVMPKPDEIRKNVENLAELEGIKLSQWTIEKYLAEGMIEVDFLAKE